MFLTHFLEFFFAPAHEPWYKGAVWGNVVAVIPMAALGFLGFWWHHHVLKDLHKAHDRHLKQILDALDPESDSETQLDRIVALVDDEQPGGITVAIQEIRKLSEASGQESRCSTKQ